MAVDYHPPTTPVTEYIIGVQTSLDPELQAMDILRQAIGHAFALLETSGDCHRVWEWADDRAERAINEKGRQE